MEARDKQGELLNVGDPVLIRGRVTQINPCGDFVMVSIEAAEIGFGGSASIMFLNDRQIEKCEEWSPVRERPEGPTTEGDSEYERP